MLVRASLMGLACLTLVVACNSTDETVDGTGGAAGAAGTGGVAGTGGTAGASGAAGTGGASGAAGTGGGSAGMAGAAGAAGATGGSGGGTATPRCDDLCANAVAADCASGPTLAGCLLTCKALTSSATCDDKANAYFDCTDATTVECNAQGDPVSTGCGVQYLVAVDCAVKADPNPAIVAPCATYCGLIAAEGCQNNGTEADCNTNCLWLGATGTGCDDELGTYLECANAATFSCVLGYAVPAGCGTDWQAYTACIDAAGN